MITLTAKKVEEIFRDCLFTPEEDQTGAVKVQEIKDAVGFHPCRLQIHKGEIRELLDQLPDTFKVDKGGGWSFLAACDDRYGRQWGEHTNMEQLFYLGFGVNLVQNTFVKLAKESNPELVDDLKKQMPVNLLYFTVDTRVEKADADNQWYCKNDVEWVEPPDRENIGFTQPRLGAIPIEPPEELLTPLRSQT